MKIILGGVRGTHPVAQPEFMAYGGETTSVLVEGAAGERILIDAGTGIRRLGERLQAAGGGSALLLLTHYHLDHIMGLPSLGLIYSDRWALEIAAPVRDGVSINDVTRTLFSRPFWPLQVEHLESNIRFVSLAGEASAAPVMCGRLFLRWCPVNHPGGCTAYRIDEPATGQSFVMATDIEWAESTHAQRGAFKHLLEFAPPSLVLFDGQYTMEEYPARRGWGHSTWTEAVDVARAAGARRLLVTHHDPARDDAQLAALDRQVAAYWPAAALARAGMEVEPAP